MYFGGVISRIGKGFGILKRKNKRPIACLTAYSKNFAEEIDKYHKIIEEKRLNIGEEERGELNWDQISQEHRLPIRTDGNIIKYKQIYVFYAKHIIL